MKLQTRIAKIKRMCDGQQFEIKLDNLQEIINIVKA